MKKYMGVCRWLSTHTRKMMAAFPITVVRYMSRRSRQRNSCSLWSSPEKPIRMNSEMTVPLSVPMPNFHSSCWGRNMAKPSKIVSWSGQKAISFLLSFLACRLPIQYTQRFLWTFLTPRLFCFTYLVESSENFLSSFHLCPSATNDSCYKNTRLRRDCYSIVLHSWEIPLRTIVNIHHTNVSKGNLISSYKYFPLCRF